MNRLQQSSLGRRTAFVDSYSPSLLFALPRQREIPITWSGGFDRWHAYEMSWLNEQGLPRVATLTIIVPASSTQMVESKSLKLYLGSFSGTRFSSQQAVYECLQADLGELLGVVPEIVIQNAQQPIRWGSVSGVCLDSLDISCDTYQPHPDFLNCNEEEQRAESLYSHLLKTNCPVTGQPDWAMVRIVYEGAAMSHAGLLRYLVSYRNHCGFHEACCEQIFSDLMERCHPRMLSVECCYTRRGGIDINPLRTTLHDASSQLRAWRQ